jgi:hypothetical protein
MNNKDLAATIKVAIQANNESSKKLKSVPKVTGIDNKPGRSNRVAEGSVDRKN